MISLITSLYRSDRYLNNFQKKLKAVADELVRKDVEFEIIVIANDPTPTELLFGEKFKTNKWFNFIIVSREPLYSTWNRGVNLSKGDVIGFWNVDDIRNASAIIEAADLFDKGADVVYFPFLIIWYLNIMRLSIPVKFMFDRSTVYDKQEFTQSMRCGPFFMFTKDIYNRTGPFDEQFKIVGDFDWCVRAAKISNKFVLAKNNAGIFRVDGRGLSSGGKPIHVAENNVVFQRNNIINKMVPVDVELVKKYDPNQILFKGEYVSLNNFQILDK